MSKNTENHNNLKIVKKFAKNQFLIIALLAVFACGFAALVMHFDNYIEDKVFKLLCFLAFLPLMSFICFFIGSIGFILLHYAKSFNFEKENVFLEKFKTDIINEISSLKEKAINQEKITELTKTMEANSEKTTELINIIKSAQTAGLDTQKTINYIKEILELALKINLENKK